LLFTIKIEDFVIFVLLFEKTKLTAVDLNLVEDEDADNLLGRSGAVCLRCFAHSFGMEYKDVVARLEASIPSSRPTSLTTNSSFATAALGVEMGEGIPSLRMH